MLTIYCPHCNAKLKAPEKLIGRELPCPKCQEKVQVTAPEVVQEPNKPVVAAILAPSPPPAQPKKASTGSKGDVVESQSTQTPSPKPVSVKAVPSKTVQSKPAEKQPPQPRQVAPKPAPSQPIEPEVVDIDVFDNVDAVDDVVDVVDVVDVEAVHDPLAIDPLAHNPLGEVDLSNIGSLAPTHLSSSATAGDVSGGGGVFWQAPAVKVPVASDAKKKKPVDNDDNSSSLPPMPVLLGLGAAFVVAAGLILTALVWSFFGTSEPAETVASNTAAAPAVEQPDSVTTSPAIPTPNNPANDKLEADKPEDAKSAIASSGTRTPNTVKNDTVKNDTAPTNVPKTNTKPPTRPNVTSNAPGANSLSVDVMDATPGPERVGPGVTVTLVSANGGASTASGAKPESAQSTQAVGADNRPLISEPQSVQPGVLQFLTSGGVRCSLSHDGKQVAFWTLYNARSSEANSSPKMFRIVDAHTGATLADLSPRGMMGVILSKHKIYGLDFDGRALHCWNRETFQFEQTKRLDIEAFCIDNVFDKWLAIFNPKGILYLDIDTLQFTPESRLASEDQLLMPDALSAYMPVPDGIQTGNIVWNRELTKPVSKLMPYHSKILSVGSEIPRLTYAQSLPTGRFQQKWNNGKRNVEGEPRLAAGGLVSMAPKDGKYQLTIKGDASAEEVSVPLAPDPYRMNDPVKTPELLAAHDSIVAQTPNAVYFIKPSALGVTLPAAKSGTGGPRMSIEDPWLDPKRPSKLKIVAKNIPDDAKFQVRFLSQSPLRNADQLIREINAKTFEVSSQKFFDPQMTDWVSPFARIVAQSQLNDPKRIYSWYIEQVNKELARLGEKPVKDFVVAIVIDVIAKHGQNTEISRPCVFVPVPREQALDILTATLQQYPNAEPPPARPTVPEPFAATSFVQQSNKVRETTATIQKWVNDSRWRNRDDPLMMSIPEVHDPSPPGPMRTWRFTVREGLTKNIEASARVAMGELRLVPEGEDFGYQIQPNQLNRKELELAVTDALATVAPIPMSVKESAESFLSAEGFANSTRKPYEPRFGSALYGFVRQFNCLPPSALADDAGKPLLSWRVMLLPHLGYNQLFLQFHLDEPWDSPHNIKLLPYMPPCYLTKDAGLERGMTKLLALTGDHTAMPGDRLMTLADLSHTLSSRVLFVVAKNELAVPWTKPVDFVLGAEGPPVAGWAVKRVGDADRFMAVTGSGNYVSLELNAANLEACYWDNANPKVAIDAAATNRGPAKPVIRLAPPAAATLPSFGAQGIQYAGNNTAFLRQAFDAEERAIALTGRVENELMLLNVNSLAELTGRQINLEAVLTSICPADTGKGKYFVVGVSKPNRLVVIDIKDPDKTNTIELGEYWAPELRAPVGEPSPYVYAVARVGDYSTRGDKKLLLRINLESGKIEKQWKDIELYDDLTLFRRAKVDFANFAQMNLNSHDRDMVAMPKRVDDLQEREIHFLYESNHERLTMFPFPSGDVSLWGNGVFTLDMQRLKQQMSFYPAAYLEGTPWVIGVLGNEFLIGSVNDGRLVARMGQPSRLPIQNFELKNEVQSHMPGIFWAPAIETLYLVGRDYLSPLKLNELALPDEPCLLLKDEPPAVCQSGKEYVYQVNPVKAKVYMSRLIEGPPNAVLASDLRWTPPAGFAGKVKFTVRISANDISHDESWTVEVKP